MRFWSRVGLERGSPRLRFFSLEEGEWSCPRAFQTGPETTINPHEMQAVRCNLPGVPLYLNATAGRSAAFDRSIAGQAGLRSTT
jgi:hypothetical protein